MVSFVCGACQETVRKPQVDKHTLKCRSCWVLTCVDCSKDFKGEEYRTHTSCISEAEKYQGNTFVQPAKGKKSEKDVWAECIQAALAAPSLTPAMKRGIKDLLEKASDNVPFKKDKFIKYCENSLKIRALHVIEGMWDAVAAEKEKRKGPVEPAAAAAPSAPSAPADEPAVAVSQEPSPIEAAGGEDAPKKRKRSRSEKVDWHALTLAALGETVTGSLELEELKGRVVAKAVASDPKLECEEATAALDAFFTAPAGLSIEKRKAKFVSVSSQSAAAGAGKEEAEEEVRPVDALATVVWSPPAVTQPPADDPKDKKKKKRKAEQ